ncbi:MAG: hypothetical protein Q8879_01530, partial [Candidatus Phytoplasma australasiaticum]|nr:hypothetical protein [Candidatus Phytoplasma australasiaticum]
TPTFLKPEFAFQERWCENADVLTIIKEAWATHTEGSLMFKFFNKLKRCRHLLVEWKKSGSHNSL